MDRVQLLAAFQQVAAEKPHAVTLQGVGEVFVRKFTVGDVDAQLRYQKEQGGGDGKTAKPDFAPTVFAMCQRLCDESGEPLFDPWNGDDRKVVARLDSGAFTSIQAALKALGEAPAEGN